MVNVKYDCWDTDSTSEFGVMIPDQACGMAVLECAGIAFSGCLAPRSVWRFKSAMLHLWCLSLRCCNGLIPRLNKVQDFVKQVNIRAEAGN